MAEALVIKGLSKRFGGLRAVQDVSFSVQENETVALIGLLPELWQRYRQRHPAKTAKVAP